MKKIGLVLCAFIICFSSIFVYADTGNKKPSQSMDLPEKKISYETCINYVDGYMINYPMDMEVDRTLSKVKTVIRNKDREIEIYYDNFKNTEHSSKAYTYYSNLFLKNLKDHHKEYEDTIYVNGMKTHLLKWERKKLSKVQNDKNYYVSAEIIKNHKEVYTIIMKSTTPFESYESYMDIINTFQLVQKCGDHKVNVKFKSIERNLNDETKEFYNRYFMESDRLRWGIFEYNAPTDFAYLNSLEDRIDYTFQFVLKYQSLDGIFPMEEMKRAYEGNHYVELTLQTMFMEGDNASVTYDILNGKYDDYFNEYAKKVKEFNHPVLFRLNNEMNGDWCVYSSYHSSKDTNLYKEVWKYVYGIFEKNQVDNVLWVWNPHDLSFPGFKWNHYLNYYPGDEYVDIIGITGYNTGNYYEGEIWREFDEIYPPVYEEYMSIFEQPFMITEFGSTAAGGDKVKWINDMFDGFASNKYPNIKVAIWWNGIDWDTNMKPARIYRMDQNEEYIKTFRERLKYFKENTDKIEE
ncbi:MAG: glycoside hydrolase family 26 protein [Anaeromicrobium sp.]|uniref:glycoside hydrolase family 26 protein n=1 Tax=Anaeromicrobium sp. TaxID=1929132 RepID=UPI0025DE8E64|nr:glycosyl hydrolase [Anaeromicrobium sp.]MCT4595191.1 glycoside hydrolase family 26 protein [Anaeromicrobium sp.]